MTTFNGFIRSTNAAINRMERAHNQRERRLAQIEKVRRKEEMLANAASVVQHYNQLIELLTSVHKEDVEPMDWHALYDEPGPILPTATHALEQKAASTLSGYQPSFFVKLFRMVEKRKKKLAKKVVEAKAKDAAQSDQAEINYRKSLAEWEFLHNMAEGVLAKNVVAYKNAVAHFDPFSEVVALGLSINFLFDADHLTADLKIQPDGVVPKEVFSLTSTGKLSKKDMPIARFNALYQDHVCSAVLRVGRESLALLPVPFIIVNAKGDLLNSVTGRIETQTVVSAAIFADTLERLNFQSLDPSDSMQNFKHKMDFSKTGGFRPVQSLTADDLSGKR